MYSSIYGDLSVKTESSVKIMGKDIMPFDYKKEYKEFYLPKDISIML